MPKKLEVNLAETQKSELETAVKHETRPYVRERAAAILKIATGNRGVKLP